MKYTLHNNRAYKVYASGKKVRVSKNQYDKYMKYRKRRTIIKGGVDDPLDVKVLIIETLEEFIEKNHQPNVKKDSLYTCLKDVFDHIIGIYPSIVKVHTIKRKIKTLRRNQSNKFLVDPYGKQKARQIIMTCIHFQRANLKDTKLTADTTTAEQFRTLYQRMCLLILTSDVANEVISSVLPLNS